MAKRYVVFGKEKVEIEIEEKTPDRIYESESGDFEFIYGEGTASEYREFRDKDDVEVVEK